MSLPWRDFANGEIPDNSLSLAPGRSDSKATLIDAERADARFKSGSGYPKPGGRSRWPEHLSAARAQRLLDNRLLVCGKFARQRARAIDLAACGQPTLVDGEFVGVAHDHGALNHILQFTHVSGPWIRLKTIESLPVDAPERLVCLPGIAMNEVLHQHRNV